MSKANSSADSKKTAVINNNTAHASDRPFGCKQCTRSFPTNAKLNAHVKDCHPVNPKDLLCEHCNGKFASIRSKNDHLQRCPQLKKQVWVPTTVVNTAKVGLRHVRDKNSLSESGIKIVELYREYLQDGSSSTFMLGRGKKNLEGASVTTYAYHLKDYLHFLEKSETEEFDYVLYFLNPLTIKDYLKHLQECRYAKKTMLNRLFALERFCGFVEEKLIELNNKQLTTLANNKRSHNKILEALNFISAQITTVSPLAQQETKIRNSRESLEAADKWIGIASLFKKEAEMKTEIDVLIERMAKPNSKPTIDDVFKVQEYIIFLMVTLRPPMRTQNLELSVLPKLESPAEAKSNGIVFTETSVTLQYSKYKTKKSYGFIRFCIDNPLADYLRKFYNHVRPWFFVDKDLSRDPSYPLFLTRKGQPIKNIGETFKKIMVKYFDKPITVGTIRKVMETALSESSLAESDKNNLSNAMLHDPATAQEYYVAHDYVTASNSVNQQWKQFRSAFVVQPTSAAPSLSEPIYVDVPVVSHVAPQLDNCQHSTQTVPMLESSVPSLVSSPVHSEEVSVEDIRETAHTIANSLVPTKSKPVAKATPARVQYPMKPGDWNCSMCGYTNFARRVECNRCGKGKNKRSAYEIEEQPVSKKAKTDQDILKVLRKAKNKDGEDICFVVSKKKGEIWVRASHVPASLL